MAKNKTIVELLLSGEGLLIQCSSIKEIISSLFRISKVGKFIDEWKLKEKEIIGIENSLQTIRSYNFYYAYLRSSFGGEKIEISFENVGFKIDKNRNVIESNEQIERALNNGCSNIMEYNDFIKIPEGARRAESQSIAVTKKIETTRFSGELNEEKLFDMVESGRIRGREREERHISRERERERERGSSRGIQRGPYEEVMDRVRERERELEDGVSISMRAPRERRAQTISGDGSFMYNPFEPA